MLLLKANLLHCHDQDHSAISVRGSGCGLGAGGSYPIVYNVSVSCLVGELALPEAGNQMKSAISCQISKTFVWEKFNVFDILTQKLEYKYEW